MNDGEFFMIEQILYFPNITIPSNAFIIGRIMGEISKTKLCPDPIGDVSFNNLPGQTTVLNGIGQGKTAYSVSSVSKKIMFFLNPSAGRLIITKIVISLLLYQTLLKRINKINIAYPKSRHAVENYSFIYIFKILHWF